MKGTTLMAVISTIAGFVFYVNIMSNPAPKSKSKSKSEEVAVISISKDTYTKGANDALDRIILLDLEQQLSGTNRNWGTMAEVVCERLGIQRLK